MDIKKILIALLLFTTPAMGDSTILAEYGKAKTVRIELLEVDGVNFKTDASHAPGDTKLTCDAETSATNTTNGFVDVGNGYTIELTADEMKATSCSLEIVDSATKVWLDKTYQIYTYPSGTILSE